MPLSQEIWCDKLTEEVKCMIPQMLKLRWLAVAFAVWGHCCAWVPAHAAPQRWRERTASALDRPATPAAPLRYPPISLAVVFSSAVGLPAERWGRRTCGKSEGVEKGEGELKTPEGDEVGWRPFVRGPPARRANMCALPCACPWAASRVPDQRAAVAAKLAWLAAARTSSWH